MPKQERAKGLKLNVKGGKLRPDDFKMISEKIAYLNTEKEIRAQAAHCLDEITTNNYRAIGMSFTGSARVKWEFKGALAEQILNLIISDCTETIDDMEKRL